MGELFNNHKAKEKRRKLRHEATPAEDLLWAKLRNRQLNGWKFRRQYSISHYIADFCCPECNIVIEIDGPSHEGEEAEIYEQNRQHYFESLGFSVMRFSNEQIYHQLPEVLENLLALCESRRANLVTHPRKP